MSSGDTVMGEKNSKRKADSGAAPELRAQIAALAEQVRRLAEAQAAKRPCGVAEPHASGAQGEPYPPPAELTIPRPDPLAVDIIAMAERAAAEIRETAQREAERIQSARPERPRAAVTDLLGILRRQGAAISVLDAEIERLAQTVEGLRAQARALEAELAQVHAIFGTSPREAAWITSSGPAASPGTSPHPPV
jgi:hypothetical protein